MYDICIAMPSVGIPEVIVPTIYSLFANMDPELKTCISVSMSSCGKSDPDEVMRQLRPVQGKAALEIGVYEDEGGFAKNSNRALSQYLKLHGKPRYVLFLNSDVRATEGWLRKMVAAFSAEKVQASTGDSRLYDASLYGRIGIVGPRSNEVAGHQKIAMPITEVHAKDAPDCDIVSAFGAQLEEACSGFVNTTDFISGFAMMVSWECLEDIAYRGLDGGYDFFDEDYGIGGYEDNDVCVRANIGGWRKAIASDTFVYHVGSQTIDAIYPDHKRGMVNCGAYIKKWSEYTQREQRLVGCYRVCLRSAEEMNMLRHSLHSNSRFLDGVSVLVSKETCLFTDSPGWKRYVPHLGEADLAFVSDALNGQSTPLDKWEKWLRSCLPGGTPLEVARYEGQFNEAAERNAAIANAHALGPDWIISIDADEMVEDRIGRDHMQRLMRNPDPLVMSYDFAWVNHWDTEKLYRVDAPWGDGGAYTHSMRGRRMWRVCGGQRYIPMYGGTDLHCGNSPDFCWMSSAFTNIRFRHYGYMSAESRHMKHSYISSIDPSPSKAKVGSKDYMHLISSDGMRLDTYTPFNGIALTMLWHSGECMTDLYRHLRTMYGMVDEFMFVWTDVCHIPDPYLEIASLYGVQWKYNSLLDRLDECRNEGIKHLNDSTRLQRKVSWCLVLDPDETFSDDHKALIALRRMAESQDTLGWAFTFQNIYRREVAEHASKSESCRMFRLHTPLPIEFGGAVHETLDHSLRRLSEAGVHPKVKYAPFAMVNDNRRLTKERMTEKLQKYAELTVRALAEDPCNARLWLVLSNTYEGMGQRDNQIRCLEKAIRFGPKDFLAYKELGLVRVRQAVEQFRACNEMVVGGSSFQKTCEEILEFLDQPRFMPAPFSHGRLEFEEPWGLGHGEEDWHTLQPESGGEDVQGHRERGGEEGRPESG